MIFSFVSLVASVDSFHLRTSMSMYVNAERVSSNGLDLNANNATVTGFFAQTHSDDKKYKHVRLVKADDVRQEILKNLGLASQAIMGSSEQQNKEDKMKIVTRRPGRASNFVEPPPQEGNYLFVSGTERLEITDDEGNTNTPVGDAGFELTVPGGTLSGGGGQDGGSHNLTAAADIPLTIKFRTRDEALIIEFVKGTNQDTPNYVVRYLDTQLPVGVQALLTITPTGMEDLRYDSNGDGTFDTVVAPNVRVTGTAAQDTTAPNVTVTYSKRQGSGRIITVNASDSETGVKTIYYRVRETGNFQIYTDPFFIPTSTDQVVEAFADDNVGNRSSPVRIVVPHF